MQFNDPMVMGAIALVVVAVLWRMRGHAPKAFLPVASASVPVVPVSGLNTFDATTAQRRAAARVTEIMAIAEEKATIERWAAAIAAAQEATSPKA